MHPRSALLVLDLINDLVHPDGTLAASGPLAHATDRGVLDRAAVAVGRARAAGVPVIYVVIGFSPDLSDFPADSPLFGVVPDELVPRLGTWGTQVHDAVRPADGEPVVRKSRVSPFHGTELAELLEARGVDTLLLAGVTTDLVVLSTAREGHDRDYRIEVLEDATATADQELHEAALSVLRRTATITTVEQALPA
ncbi:cysteine hydrolase [Solihabitans fulvus]|uniref:Cysteine hydrolase n=1 Tax=Solihabitans fulvus TaxID=1892852 RepID=A0A5B2XU24_9PSEU|nr:isochorismatase family cysteine hydrolase [Solihabitans fulvus]KAA2266432.1 cysteine hydrolase [Solihabitans fulvus]